MYDVDLFVIGAGSGGVRAARMAASLGASVALAEDRYFGGTCVNVGCVPKKLYTFAAHYAADFADSAGYGWSLDQPVFDWPTLRDNKKAEIRRLNGIYRQLLEKAGVRILDGRASLVAPHSVQVNEQLVTARYILIGTGAWPFIPDIPGKEHVLTSNEIFDLNSFPQRLLVVGGGYIAVEFAGIFSGLGSKTTLSYRGDTLLRGFDADVSRHFMQETVKHMTLMLGSEIRRVERTASSSLNVLMEKGHTLEVDAVLMATGRVANTRGLGLENTSVQLDPKGNIKVNGSLCTDEPSIYALGDVVGRRALTPVALAEGMFIADHLFGSGQRTLSYDNIPTAVFSHPNIASVGMSEERASAQFGEISVFETDFRHLRHTLSGSTERTYMKVIVNKASDLVVGMHMVGRDAGEIIQGFAAAMVAGITKGQLDTTLGIHPSAAEEFVTMRTARQEKH
jgi:glutathione reductase (NADPH)